MFSLGLAAFTLASAACGLAPSPAVLVGARLVQGLAAALLSPQVLSIIGVVYSGPERVRAISIYGIVLGFAAVGGQLIGGVLVQADIAGLGWRSCFLINVPDRPRRADGRRARGARVARRGRPPPGPRRDRADHARPRRHRPAARRGPPARLARVDVAVPGRGPADAGRVRRPPAAPEPPRRRAAAGSRAVPRARVQRGPRDPARVLLDAWPRTSSCSRCTCSRAAGWTRCRPGWSSRSWPRPTWWRRPTPRA